MSSLRGKQDGHQIIAYNGNIKRETSIKSINFCANWLNFCIIKSNFGTLIDCRQRCHVKNSKFSRHAKVAPVLHQ